MIRYVTNRFGTRLRRFFIETKKDWLYSRGGRTMAHMFSDDNGDYTWMRNHKWGDKKVYLPKDLM